MDEYRLTIMEPGEKEIGYQFFEGSKPIPTVNKGDRITYTAPHFELLVTEIMHQFWETGGVTKCHTIVYTELINHRET